MKAALTIDDLSEVYLRWASENYRKPGVGALACRPTRTIYNIRDALRELRETPDPDPPMGMLWREDGRRLGDLPAALMTTRLLRVVRDRMAASGRLNRQTCNDRLGWIKRMFAWAADPEQEFIPEEIAARVALCKPLRYARSPAPESQPVRSVPVEWVRNTALYASRRLATMMWVQWYTGMRPGELVQMSRSTIDQSQLPWLYQPMEHKTQHHGKSRTIFLGREARNALTPWLESLPASQDWLFEGGRHERLGRPMTAGYYGRAIARINERHGLDHWHPNQIRHSYATRVERTDGREAAQLLLDHSSDKVTRRYIDPDLQKKRDLAERFG